MRSPDLTGFDSIVTFFSIRKGLSLNRKLFTGCVILPFSIKNVLPVLVPGMGYDDLEIAEGTMASVQYMLALANEDHEERERTFANLRAYCERDTYAMVRLKEALSAI